MYLIFKELSRHYYVESGSDSSLGRLNVLLPPRSGELPPPANLRTADSRDLMKHDVTTVQYKESMKRENKFVI